MASGKEMTAILKIVGNLDPSLQQAVSNASKTISSIGKGAAIAGAAVATGMAAATTAVVAFGAKAVEAASSYEQAFANASTLMSGTEEEIQALSDGILAVSNNTGVAADEITNAVYSALSAGIEQDQVLETVEASAKLAAAGFTDIDTALSATAKTLNAYGSDAISVDEIQKILIQTQNKGITTVNELGASLAQVTPTAAAFGVSFDQVGASLATMTAQGTPTAQATTQLNSLIAELGKSGTIAANNLEKAAEGTEYAGMSFAEMQASGASMSDILGMISSMADESGLSMVDMFSSIEAGKAALSIFNAEGSTFNENLEAMGTEADVVGEAYDTVTDTLEHQMEVLQNLGQNAMISIGQKILPYVTEIAQAAIPMIEEALDNLFPIIDNIMAIAGPIIRQIGQTLLPMIANAITGVGANVQGILPVIQSAVTWILNGFSSLAPIVSEFVAGIMPVAVQIGQQVFAIIQQVFPILANIASMVLPVVMQLIQGLAPVISTLLSTITPVLSIIGTFVDQYLPLLISRIEFLIPIVTTAANIVATVLANAFKLLTPIINAVITVISGMASILESTFQGIAGTVIAPINAVISVVNSIIDAVNSISIDIPSWVPIYGGSTFGLSLSHIPTFAQGGFTDGISIAGEAGREAIISFDSAYRSANLNYWMEAGQLLGALDSDGSVNTDSALAGQLLTLDNFSLSELSSAGTTYVYDFSGMQFNPTINANSSDKADWMQGLREAESDFEDWINRWMKRREEVSYAS
ncbi:MAG: phage tail tape measure protein [Butyrivibrio sp.]|nr:phage tail tape measure protein [Butyrivibrio sp.]